MSELVSVIVPCYNAEQTVGDAIDSILNCGYRNVELLCVDDASTDGTLTILQSAAERDQRIQVITRSLNGGVARARNDGIRVAHGRYIAFCDADDQWLVGKLTSQIALMKAVGAACAHGAVVRVDARTGREKIFTPRLHVDLSAMKVRNWIVNSAGIYDAHAIGRLEQPVTRHEDYLMWLEVLRRGGASVAPPDPVAIYCTHGRNLTRNKARSLVWHLRAQRLFGMTLSAIAVNFLRNIISRV